MINSWCLLGAECSARRLLSLCADGLCLRALLEPARAGQLLIPTDLCEDPTSAPPWTTPAGRTGPGSSGTPPGGGSRLIRCPLSAPAPVTEQCTDLGRH